MTDPDVPPTPRLSTFEVLKHRDFALLWFGQSISSFGDGVFNVALVIETLHIDPHPSGLAVVVAARTVPAILLALLGGVIVDRVPKRLAMLASDVLRGAAVGGIALLDATHTLNLAELVAMSVAFGVGDSFFSPASMSMIPELLPDTLLVQANGFSSTSSNLAQSLVGPATGGAIVGFIGTTGSFAVDALSYVASILSLAAMSARPRPAASGKSVLTEAREGLAYIRSRQWLSFQLVAASFANFFGIAPLTVLLALLVRHVMHASPLALGLVLSAGGVAGVAASLVVARLGKPPHRVVVMWTSYALSSVAIAFMAIAPNPFVVGILSAFEVGLIVYGDVLYVAMMQELVPAELRGRVFSAAFLVAFVLTPLGTMLGGVAASLLGTRTAILLSGVLSGVCCLVCLAPQTREPDSRLQ